MHQHPVIWIALSLSDALLLYTQLTRLVPSKSTVNAEDFVSFAVVTVTVEVFAAMMMVSGLYPVLLKLTICDLPVARALARLPGPDRWETIPEKVLVPDWNLMILYTSTFIWDAMVAKYMPCGKFAMDNVWPDAWSA